jgi:hypothetical protein
MCIEWPVRTSCPPRRAPDSRAGAIRDLLPWVRTKPEAETRRACLYAFAAVTLAAPPLEPPAPREEDGDIQWLAHVARDDPDDACRRLAAGMLAAAP